MYNLILSKESLRYRAICYCPFPLIYITVQYDIVIRNTKISSSILLSFSINTYLNNTLLSEETLRYPAAYYCPSPLIHTFTIKVITKLPNSEQSAGYLSVSSDNMILYRYVLVEKYNNILFEYLTLIYPAACHCPFPVKYTCTI